ncbi:unnamed protein product [Spirodela intermedia]|uniref:Uncharacterized protein n=1 Tax=Spirodela intermedia TaxID=51605 RepID=A0A7I8IZ45_SPIIN|nr:unnamed protein product [Spirodela intermedia]CAA6663148.1 unnamed protein product [Spirodela intermedia]
MFYSVIILRLTSNCSHSFGSSAPNCYKSL